MNIKNMILPRLREIKDKIPKKNHSHKWTFYKGYGKSHTQKQVCKCGATRIVRKVLGDIQVMSIFIPKPDPKPEIEE